jgi:hypothetical protein
MNLELTDKETNAVVSSIVFMINYIKTTTNEPDNLTELKEEMMVQFINILEKIDYETENI